LITHIETPGKESKPDISDDADENSAENENRGRVILDVTKFAFRPAMYGI
jgi:hypothetical protein